MEKNFDFDDIEDEDELDFVRSHEKIPVSLHITAIDMKNKVNKMTKKDHIENLSDIMDSMPDDTCGDWRDSIAYAIDVIENLDKNNDTSDNINQIIDKMKKEFIDKYPKNYMGGLELDGRSCVFSLNEILKILDKYKKGENHEKSI